MLKLTIPLGAVGALLLAGCGANGSPDGNPVSLQSLRNKAPAWSKAVIPAGGDLATCLARALRESGSTRLTRWIDGGGAFVAHYPSFFSASADFEVTVYGDGSDVQVVQLRHHAASPVIAELRPRLERDVARVQSAVRSCTAI